MSEPSFSSQTRSPASRAAGGVRSGGVLESAGEAAATARAMLQRMILHELSAAERLLVLLWYAERMSSVEVAMALDLTESQAVSMHDRIVARLRAALVSE